MLPLVLANTGDEHIIKKISGNDEVKKHLENLGFTPGTSIKIINTLCGNVIVKVKDSRVALNEDMARRIMV
ncbi:FeoA family protein [Treponema sp. C6A8]|uniref:FeoA family protein n=1 Tax=Treponema sp. C6A8 TaxID=1410609 RepID=UPI0004806B5E|nr:FeoA family protein [Treponema sp. C6A8]